VTDIRDRIEAQFSNLARLIYRRAWLFLLFSLLFTGILSSFIPDITMDTSAEGMLHKEDPALKTFKIFRDQFGRDQMVIIGLKPVTLFDFTFLRKLKKFHNALKQEIPYLYEINSLVNATYIHGEGDNLFVEDLLETLPATREEMENLRHKVLEHPLYRGTIISEDGTFTIITLKPSLFSNAIGDEHIDNAKDRQHLTKKELNEFVSSIENLTKQFNSPDFPLYLGGDITAEKVLTTMTMETMGRFMILTTLLVILLTAILFRRLSGVIFPFIVINCALFTTMGLMAIFNVPITLNTTILPSFLLAVGIGDSVHILTIFYRHYDDHQNKEDAISYALGHSGLAVIMTSLTTAGGLLSFVGAGVAPVAALGIFAAVGVMLALIFTLITLPALLALSPLKLKKRNKSSNSFSRLDRFLVGIGDFATGHPWPVVLVSGTVITLSFILAMKLNFSHNSLIYLPEDNMMRRATEMIDQKMNGSIRVEVLVDTGRKNGLYDPAIMNDIDKAKKLAEKMVIKGHRVGSSVAITNIIKEMNMALHGGDIESFTLPQNRELIAQELLLYEIGGGEDLRTLVDADNRQARISTAVPWLDAVEYNRVLALFEKQLSKIFADKASVTVTGIVAIICRTFSSIIHTMASSYMIAGLVISLLMILLIGNVKLGMISMIPNFAPIITGLGFMWLINIPLDYSTIMVGGIAIGLAVDDTVHFMHNFRRYYNHTGDAIKAVHMTLSTTGRAMLFTTLILCAGFYVLIFAELKSTANFGLITGFTICVALLADFLLAPALMVLITQGKK